MSDRPEIETADKVDKRTNDPVEKQIGKNGVAIQTAKTRAEDVGSGFRTYEVHQRERVGESTEKIKPRALISDDFRRDPYPLLKVLRENYPCYRDWLGNRYWVTAYNDATSIFADDANFETRSKAWFLGLLNFGRDFNDCVEVQRAYASVLENSVVEVTAELVAQMVKVGGGNFTAGIAGPLAMRILARSFGVPADLQERFAGFLWAAQRGTCWQGRLEQQGRDAVVSLAQLFEPLLAARRETPGTDVVSAMLNLDDSVTAADVAVTLLERDLETLQGALANLWLRLLSLPDEYAKARSDARLMKLAYLETLRHSTPVVFAKRFARHEVERFGRLLPAGAQVLVCAGAANRDPEIFENPDQFIVDRKDLCQREPRGHYRADGLATGMAVGLGKPSIYPAVPEDRPRSLYALTRDAVVAASMTIVEAVPNIALASGQEATLTALTVGEMHTAWQLPVSLE